MHTGLALDPAGRRNGNSQQHTVAKVLSRAGNKAGDKYHDWNIEVRKGVNFMIIASP